MTIEHFSIGHNNLVIFYQEGHHYYEKYLDLINHAQKSIHLQTYIFHLDRFGEQVKDALIKASTRGVKVYLVVDSVGSRKLSQEAELELKMAGVQFYRFNGIRLKWLYRWGRRLHHKVLLIDDQQAIVGGINVQYGYQAELSEPQLDFAVYLRGPVISDLSLYCQTLYKKTSKSNFLIEKVKNKYHFPDGYDVGLSVNDWIHRRSKITEQYSRITLDAKKEITIINSYFFPRKKFMKQLIRAAKRGVRVRLILPKYSDWPSYILASEYLYNYFLKRGVEIYQWNKSILHGKIATVDNKWSTIGSFNLNYTSYQQNLEMNVDVYSAEFTTYLNSQIEAIISEGCERIDLKTLNEKSSLKTRLSRFFFYIILALIANFSIGLSFQEDHNQENRFFNLLRFSAALFFFTMGVIGSLLPVIPGFPFFIISFLLIYKQILLNKKVDRS